MAKVIQTCYTCGSAWDLEEADAVRGVSLLRIHHPI